MTVEAIVLAKDEEGNIRDCLRSLLWADGLTVFLDSRSSDDTARISASLGARVLVHPFHNFAEQRNAALKAAWGDWVFFFDADERSTPALAEETREVVTRSQAGWWVPRDNYIFGRLTRHAGWYPDYQLRLLRRGCASYDLSRPVHETVLLQGEMGYLKNALVHYNYYSLRQFCEKQRHYARLDAEALARQGVHPRPHSLVMQPLREFRRRFVELHGYKDGLHGLLLSLLLAYYTFRTYGYLVLPRREALPL
ncbi:MAG: glycosyltransferase family 2 protein [Anaerolineae bacterium]